MVRRTRASAHAAAWSRGKVRTYIELGSPLGLTYFKGALYAGTFGPTDDEGNPTGPGTVVRIR